MNKTEIKLAITSWLMNIEQTDVLPENIVALNFGLFEPYGIELIGSNHYDAQDDEWACEEDFVPTIRQCPNIVIDASISWQSVLEMMSAIIQELVIALSDSNILQVNHITIGFNDGDLHIIK